jgi:hypothetical protein
MLTKHVAIEAFFTENYPDDKLTKLKNFRQSQSNLMHFDFDLLLLDMSFEVHGAVSEDSSFNGLAGLHVLQFMWASAIEIPTIICTSHDNYSDPDFGRIEGIDELRKYTKRVFGDVVLGCIRMGPDEVVWGAEIKGIIENAGV